MKPVMQSNTNVPGGDCLRACVASILELSLVEVPHFAGEEPHEKWFERMVNWLAPRGLGLAYTQFEAPAVSLIGHCILGVRTQRANERQQPKEWVHAVVGWAETMSDGRLQVTIAHDPHPNPSTTEQVLDILWIVRNANGKPKSE